MEPELETELYEAALASGEPSKCAQLNVTLRGDCIAATASTLAKTDPQAALYACDTAEQQKWRSECFFSVSDTAKLIGSNALEVCALTGNFQNDCLRHAAAREVEQFVFPRLSLDDPTKAFEPIQKVISMYLGDDGTGPMTRDMIIRWWAGHVVEPFTRTSCLNLSDDTCAQVWIVHSLGSGSQVNGDEPLLKHCNEPLAAERAAFYGLSSWERSAEGYVQQAWQQICKHQGVEP